jgi:phasin
MRASTDPRSVALAFSDRIFRPQAATKETTDMTMGKDPMSGFEIAPEMRNLAEQSVAQAKKAFDGFIAAAQQTLTTFEGQATAAQAGAKDVAKKAMTFAERNVANSFDFAQKIVRAKDVQEVMRLQAEFVKAQMEALSEQARELGASATKAATDQAKSQT